MPKFANWFDKTEYILRGGRKIPVLGMPKVLSLLIVMLILLIDVVSIYFGITEFLATFCAYMSALILLLELTYEAGMKVGVKWLNAQDKPETQEEKINRYRRCYNFWFITYVWFVNPVKQRIAKYTTIDPFGWGKDEELISTYKLRFSAFALLIFAINFDICSRLF